MTSAHDGPGHNQVLLTDLPPSFSGMNSDDVQEPWQQQSATARSGTWHFMR
jgi:hypothetical protein